MARNFGAECIVVKRTNFGETDRIVTFLSKYKGKFSAVAKGVRKISSKRASSLELLNHSVVYFTRGSALDIVTEAKSLKTFRKIKEDLLRTSFGLHILEITNSFLEDGQGGSEVFDLVVNTLELLEKVDPEELPKISRSFELKFLEELGFRPELRKCVRCRQDLMPVTNFLSPFSGGVVHGACVREDVFARPIEPSSLKVLRFLQGETLERIEKLVLNKGLNEDLEEKTRFYLEYLLEKDLKTARFISQEKLTV